MCQKTQMPFIFSDIRQCFRSAQTKSLDNQKFGHGRIFSNRMGNFKGPSINDIQRQRQTEFRITDRQTFLILSDSFLIYPFGSRTFLSGGCKNTGIIGLLEK